MTREFLYLHGFASGPTSRKALFFRRRLEAEGCRVEIPDLSQGDFENLTITRQLEVIERAAAGRRVALIGSSLGGYLAALYAGRRPETDRLLLLAPAFGFARRWAGALGEELREWKQKGWKMVFHYGEGRLRPVRYRLIEDGLLYEDEPAVSQPTLIFHGSRDTVVRPEWSLDYARTRPNVRVELVDSDHELLDALDEIWQRSRNFLLAGP